MAEKHLKSGFYPLVPEREDQSDMNGYRLAERKLRDRLEYGAEETEEE